MLNKKGLVDRSWHWFISMIILTVTTFTIIGGIQGWEQSILKTPSMLEERLVAYRLVNTPECLATQNEGRIQSGILDLQKISERRITQCLQPTKVQYWIRISSGQEDLLTMQTERMERTGTPFITHGVLSGEDLVRIEVEVR